MNLHKIVGKLFIGLLAFFSTTLGLVNAETKWDCCDRGCHLGPAQPCCEDCGFFVGADFLYWNVNQANLDYAVDGRDTEIEILSFIDEGALGPGKMHFMDFDWDAGFRIVAGWRFGCDGWDARAIYTYFHGKAAGSTKANNAEEGSERQLLEATLLAADAKLDAQNAAKASACNSLDYDVLDILLCKSYCISKTLITRPYIGVRALWMHQNLRAKYIGGEKENGGVEEENGSEPDLIDGDSPRIVKYHSDWEGVGLHAGMENSIRLCGCFGLYGNISGSILAGRNCSHNKQRGFEGSAPSEKRILDVKEKEYTALPGYHIGGGINWETEWCEMCFVMNLGYEMTQWLHTPQIRRYNGEKHNVGSTSANSGNILLHGVTLNANVYF